MMHSDRQRVMSEQGSIAPAIPIYALAIFLLASLVIAATLQLNGRSRAVAYAEEAARAGASAIDLTSEKLQLNWDDVAARVEGYCEHLRSDKSADVTACDLQPQEQDEQTVVTVDVTLKVSSGLLGMFAVNSFTAGGKGSAQPYEGASVQDATN